ncbi:uncharacterized protein PG998_007974 [Apiospora kogelbergensis]|uniref:Uncharacterized protein n=1 Tax=Apiospora kogelbergensis TaxID=1337665 RepID=A0AAW0QHF0_9PEZI
MRHAYYDPEDPSPESFCCSRTNENGAETWHAVSQLSLSDPKASSVTIDVSCVSEWSDYWWELNLESDITSPDFPSLDDDDQSPGPCPFCGQVWCGQGNPYANCKLTVHASTEGGHVTIRDFVTNMHPRLTSMREDLLRTLGNWELHAALPADTQFRVLVGGCNRVDVVAVQQWLVESRSNLFPEHRSPPRRLYPSPSPPPDTTPVGGIDPRVERSNDKWMPPGLLDAHIWPSSYIQGRAPRRGWPSSEARP